MNKIEYNTETKSKNNTWRIIIGNINSFPTGTNGINQYKLDKLQTLLNKKGIDIALISEHNRNVQKLPFKDRPSTIMKRWWPQAVVRLSCLASNNNSYFEPGGTMIITHSRATAHTCSAGEDAQGLGRWNFITLKGKLDTYTMIISIYRPAKSQETYSRQVAYSAKRRKTMSENTSPETLWYSDMGALIKEHRDKGHNVIVAGDFNDDLNNEHSTTRIFINNMGMRELLLEREKQGLATYIRGTTTFDGVFATSGIRITNGKYTSFEDSPSDHRWMLIDVQDSIIIGSSRDNKCPPISRKVTSKIPSVKGTFQHELEIQVLWHNLHHKINELYKVAIEEKALQLVQNE